MLISFLVINVYGQQKESNSKFRREFLDNINFTRQKGCTCGTTYMPPAPPLVWNEQLETAAIGHAFDMADENYFSHTSKDGRTMEKRIATAGYTFKGFKSFMIGEKYCRRSAEYCRSNAGLV